MVADNTHKNQSNQLSLFSGFELALPPRTNITKSDDPETKELKLRDYQLDVISKTKQYHSEGKTGVLIYAPTGAGKTVISGSIIADYLGDNKKVLFVAHRIPLIKQTVTTVGNLLKKDVPVSIFQGENTVINPDANLIIGMCQSLRLNQLPDDLSLIVFDEVHTTAYFKIVRQLRNKYHFKAKFIGLSATPWRTKSKENFCWLFDCLVRSPDINQLIEKKHLTHPRCYGYNGIKDYKVLDDDKKGDFTAKSLSIVCNPEFNTEIVQKYLHHCLDDNGVGKQAIAFCANVKQAKNLSSQFQDNGVRTAVWVGSTPEVDRQRIQKQFRKKDVQIIISVSCLCEGFDEPSAEVALVARPTKSRALFFQMIGRVLRLYPTKKECMILDFGDNFERIGSPLDGYKIRICNPPPKEKIFEGGGITKECPICGATLHPAIKICPECGHVFEMDTSERQLFVDNFGEILSKEQRKQVKYYRSQIRRIYTTLSKSFGSTDKQNQKALNPICAKFLFREKFGKFPPDDWARGAIFGVDKPKYRKEYRTYLEWLFPHKNDYFYVQIMNSEFGKYSTKKVQPKNPKVDLIPNYSNWRKILGIESSATFKDAKDAYRQLAIAHHPDLMQDNPDATAIMQNINLAFEFAKKQLS